MAVLVDTRTGPVIQSDGAGDQPLRQGRMGSLIVTPGHGQYFEPTSRRYVYRAHGTVTNINGYLNGTGFGPILWNSSQVVNLSLISVGWGLTIASLSSVVLGITGAAGQYSNPTTSAVIGSVGNGYIGGPNPQATVVTTATMTNNTGTFLIPFGQIASGALTVNNVVPNYVDFGGSIVVPPGAWIGVAASALASASVMTIGLVWEEVPIGN